MGVSESLAERASRSDQWTIPGGVAVARHRDGFSNKISVQHSKCSSVASLLASLPTGLWLLESRVSTESAATLMAPSQVPHSETRNLEQLH